MSKNSVNRILLAVILMKVAYIECTVFIKTTGLAVSENCGIDESKMQTRTNTECILYCERTQKKSLMRNDKCICIDNDCDFQPENNVEYVSEEKFNLFTKVKTWQLITTEPICFGARDDSPAFFTVPKNGPITAIKLIHVNGFVKCIGWSKDTNWGCKDADLDTWVTDAENTLLFPFHQRAKYRQDDVQHDTKELTLTSPVTGGYQAKEGEILKIWYGEDLIDGSETDNSGVSCARVFLHYATM